MDDIVLQSMLKWPNVPSCFGWLGLDARGHWYMRDADAQAVGTFSSQLPGAKGSLLQHEGLIDFIHRNYASDAQGQWYFQNGPQRVYVELEATPWVWRLGPDWSLHAQTGQLAAYQSCVLDEHGWLYVATSLGLGLVHTLDMDLAASALDAGAWSFEEAQRADLPARYGFVRSPAQRQQLSK
jgi:hypothetical protein